MTPNQFQLVSFKYDDNGLLIDYVLDPAGRPRGCVVAWSKSEHNIPNQLIKIWQECSWWIAAIEGYIPASILEKEFGLDTNLSHPNKTAQMTKKMQPERCKVEHLEWLDFNRVRANFNPVSLKIDPEELGLQIAYEFRYLDYKAKVKRKTPSICINRDEAKTAAAKQDKFKYAVFPWMEQLDMWLDRLKQAAYEVAKMDAEAKAAYQDLGKQMTIDDVISDTMSGGPATDFEQRVQQQMNLN
ncbi:MAG: hypothetical protein ACPGXZ_17120 [Saprospiraceae bacterium]